MLLWHFAFWHLREVRDRRNLPTPEVLAPGLYRDVVAIFADLSAFSSYVCDTRDERIVSHVLTSFYSKARYQVINSGGMLYQFLGDGVVALFGVLDQSVDFARQALECACALTAIGDSVENDWQRMIDHVQGSMGAHTGIAIGDLQIMPLRPFSRTHLGCVADSINSAARLSSVAGPGEIVVSNAFYQKLSHSERSRFEKMEPVQAKNIGLLKSWKLPPGRARVVSGA